MRAVLMVLGAAVLAGCGPSAAQRKAEIDRLKSEAEAYSALYQAAVEARAFIRSEREKSRKVSYDAAHNAKASADAPMDLGDDEVSALIERKTLSEAEGYCWQDYCPCTETGPTDRVICRNLKGGLPVDDLMMSAGAAQRDARRELDRWNRKNPGYEIDY